MLPRTRPDRHRSRHPARWAAVLVVAGVALFSVTGCVAEVRPGQTEAAATTQLLGIPGVVSANVSSASVPDGMSHTSRVSAQVTVARGSIISNYSKLLKFVLDVAWSANEVAPNSSVSVKVITPGGMTAPDLPSIAAAFDWPGQPSSADAGHYAGWATRAIVRGGPEYVEVVIPLPHPKLVAWPGAVPVGPQVTANKSSATK